MPAMNLEPRKPDSEIQNVAGSARVFATLAVLILATIAILVVLDVIPRSAIAEVSAKTGMVVVICAIAAAAIGFLTRR